MLITIPKIRLADILNMQGSKNPLKFWSAIIIVISFIMVGFNLFLTHRSSYGVISFSSTEEAKPAYVTKPLILKIVTYNIQRRYFHANTRIPALLRILQESHADIIALQEVKDWFMDIILKQSWVKSQFVDSMKGEVKTPRGQLLLLSKFPIIRASYLPLMSDTYRTYLLVEIRAYNHPFRIGVVHLDHRLETGRMRAYQLDYCFNWLDRAENAILMGDFNFGDGAEPESSHIRTGFLDMWKVLRPNEAGFTWNMEENDMSLKKALPNEQSRRLDRIYVNSKLWKPHKIKIIGNKPVSSQALNIFPSDHFGLYAELKLNQ